MWRTRAIFLVVAGAMVCLAEPTEKVGAREFPAACLPAPEGMVLWLPFDEGTPGPSANLVGPNAGTQSGSLLAVAGKVSGALEFDGVSSRVDVATYSGIFDLLDPGTGDFTIEAWVYRLAGDAGVRDIVDKRVNNYDGFFGFEFFLYDGRPGCQLADGAYNSWYTLPTEVVPTTGWHHVAVAVVRGSTTGGRFYLDGQPLGSPFDPTSHRGSLSNDMPLRVGAGSFDESVFHGGIDEVGMYNRALSAPEIKSIYDAQSEGRCKCDFIGRPDAYAGPDQVLTCVIAQINLSGSSSTPGATFSWVATDGGHIVSGATTATPLVDQPGTYTLTVTDPANGCTATDVALVTNACPDACVPAPAGMVLWLPFDEGTPGPSANLMGPNTGTQHGSLLSVPGEVAGALQFDGATSYVDVASSPAINPGTGDFSIDAWVYRLPGDNGIRVIADKRYYESIVLQAYTGFAFFLSSGLLGCALAEGWQPNGSQSTWYASPAGTVPPTGWHHVAVTVDRDNVYGGQFYLDGSPVGTTFNPTSRPGSLNSNMPFRVGANSFNGGAVFLGRIDEVEMHRRVLTADEIKSIYDAQFYGKCKCQYITSVDAGPDKILTCMVTQINLSGSSSTPGATFSWVATAGGHIASGSTSATPLVDQPGTYTLTVTDPANGCTATDVALVIGNCPDACVPTPTGIISWWPGDGNANDIVHNHNGTLLNGATFATGMVGSALSLDGINDYVQVADDPSLNFGPSPGGDFSIDAWIKTDYIPGTASIVDKRVVSGGSQGYAFFMSDGNLAFQLGQGGGPFDSYINYFSAVYVADGAWHMVTVTVDRDNPTGGHFYLDGNPAPLFTFDPTLRPGSLINSAPLLIGSRGGPFRGLIDEVELFNRSLDPTEVEAIYAAGIIGKCKCQYLTNVDAGPDQVLTCIVTQINLAGSSSTPGAVFSWVATDGGNIVSGAATATPLVDQPGTYTLTVTDVANGCIVTDVALVTEDCPCVPAPTGMVAWWPLDETSGSTVTDIVGGFNGTALPGVIGPYAGPGPVTSTSWPPPNFPTGKVGNSLSFYGDRRVEVPSNTALEPGTGDFTIDAWVIYTATGSGPSPTIVRKKDVTGVGYGYRMTIRDYSPTAGILELHVQGTTGNFNFPSPTIVTPNAWHHVGFTLRRALPNDIVTCYYDGAVVRSEPVGFHVGNVSCGSNLFIGGDGVSAGECAVDEVELFNRVLDASEMQAIWNAGAVGKCRCIAQHQGDINGDRVIDVFDVIGSIDVAFGGALDPQDPLSPTTRTDVNDDGVADVFDVIYLIATAFGGGPDPVNPCNP